MGLLTQWFDPEPGPAALPGVLARGLARRGHEVTVLTGFPNYPHGHLTHGYSMAGLSPRHPRLVEESDGVRVVRVPLYPSHDASFARRALNYASFGASAALAGGPGLRDLDALWVNYSPITVAAPMWRARFAAGVPLVVHVADLWPDTVWAGGFAPEQRAGRTVGGSRGGSHDSSVSGSMSGSISSAVNTVASRAIRGGLDAWCRAMYASAHTVTYISPGVRDILAQRGVPEHKLAFAPMWAEESTFAPATPQVAQRAAQWRRELGIGPEEVLVLYAGAIGHAQGLQTLVEAALAVTDRPLRVVIAGSGTALADLEDLAATSSSTSPGMSPGASGRATFVGRVDQSQMPVLMAAADACYVGLSRDRLSAVTMPSKTQATMAAGRPLVVSADGDVAAVVDEAGAGWTTGSGDVAGLTEILRAVCDSGPQEREERGRRGREAYEATFSVERAVDRAEAHLVQAARSRRGRR